MRCITLANALAEQGAGITFVAARMPDALEGRILAAGHGFERIPSSPELQREGPEWEKSPLSSEAQLADVGATGSAIGQSDWIIVDHYLFDACWHSTARSFADRLLVIDDLANRSYDCDILLDQTFGRSAEDYRGLVPGGARALTGSTYALLRPEFARERPAALARRRAGGAASRILISMGTSDPNGITSRILERVLAAAPECAIDVVLGPQAASLERVGALGVGNPNIFVHVDSDCMAELMRDADIAIGAAGTTSWERCCLGLPTITLVMAENQRLVAANLERSASIVVAESEEAVPVLLRSLLDDEHQRHSLMAAAFAIVDGSGVARVCNAVFGSLPISPDKLCLRQADASDIETLWLWRNDPLMRTMAKNQEPITWKEHARWFARTMQSASTSLYIVELPGEAVAMVRFDFDNDEACVSINVAPGMRGQGIGAKALMRACEAYAGDHPDIVLTAEIRPCNTASKSAFCAAGFEETDQGNEEMTKFIRRRVPPATAIVAP